MNNNMNLCTNNSLIYKICNYLCKKYMITITIRETNRLKNMKRAINTIKRWLVQVFGLPIYQITNRVVVERFYSEFDEQFYQKGTKIESYNFVNDSETDKMPIMLQAKADTEIIGARFVVSDGSTVQFTENLTINNDQYNKLVLLSYKTAIQNQTDIVECVFSHFAPVSQINFNLLPKTTISVITIIKDKNEKDINS